MKLGSKALAATAIFTALAIALTGCTPPMPPEVKAALAEKHYVCEPGAAVVNFPHAVVDLAVSWQDSLAGACQDMSLSIGDGTADAAIAIDAIGVKPSDAYLSVPFALDATVVAVNIAGLSSINLSAASIQGILKRQITDWADPAIEADNPGLGLTSEPILLDPRIQNNGLSPFVDWMKRLNGGEFDSSEFESVAALTVDDALVLPEGGIAFLPYSVNAEAMWVPAAIVLDSKHPNESAVLPDSDHINSAGSQLKAVKSATEISVKLNPEAKPLAPAGQDQAVSPYQAVYAVNLHLLGKDNLLARAVARFLLRQDSQGMLGASYLLPLPEAVRVEELDAVAEGLSSAK